MTTRKPLRPEWRTDDDPRRLEALRQQGLDKDMNPLDATPLEQAANKAIQDAMGINLDGTLPPTTQHTEKENPMKFPKWLVTTAQVIASICSVAVLALPVLAGLVTLPGWLGFALFALGSVAMLIAGLGLPSPFAGKPILYGPAAVAAGTAALALFQMAEPMPEGFLRQVLLVVAMVLAGAAGASLDTKPKPTTA